MKDFIAIDFETANPQRVSACAIGYAKVSDYKVIEAEGYLIKPIGGHAPFQSKIHGITDKDTLDKPVFGDLFPKIQDIFCYPLVAHTLFDMQVLNALSDYFNLGLKFDYIDSCAMAKEKMPNLNNHRLQTLVQHFGLPEYKYHDAKEDAIACANVFIKLLDTAQQTRQCTIDELSEFKGMLQGILADEEVNYKEAYELLYWLEDHTGTRKQHHNLYRKIKRDLNDDNLTRIEALEIKLVLAKTLADLR